MTEWTRPGLVAAWPGMGAVAHVAASSLARALEAEPVTEVSAGEHFEAGQVQASDGLLQPLRRPRTAILGWKRPPGGDRDDDLLILLAEQQPTSGARVYCGKILDEAARRGVERVVTFAALATPSPPDAPARVFAAATDAALLEETRPHGVEILREGEIGGLNGVFLAEAAERGLPGLCLLGEFPYFAGAVPNPKASAAILRSFAGMAGIELDLTELDRRAESVERQLVEHVRKLEEASRAMREQQEGEIPEDWPRPEREYELAPEDARRVESLFEEAARDRQRAFELKSELDRLGVLKSYEDRFLDLFKRGE